MKNLTVITAVSFIAFMSSGFISPVNSLYAESLGASYVAIGLLGTTSSLTAILFSIVWGRVSDHLGQRKMLLVLGLATLAIGYGLMVIVPSYVVLFPLTILISAALAAYATASLAMMGDLLEQRGERGRRMGTYRGLSSLGFALTAFLAGSIADRFSIRVPFGLCALLLAVSFLLALRVEEPAPHATTQAASRNVRGFWRLLLVAIREAAKTLADQFTAVFRRKSDADQSVEARAGSGASPDRVRQLPLAPLLISASLWSLAFGAVYAVWANYMVRELDYTAADVGRLWSLAALCEFPMMILAGWLSDRLGRLPMLSLGFLAWVSVFAGYVLTPMMPWIVLIQLMRGFAYSAYTATAMTYAAEVRSRSQRGQVSGLYSSSGSVGAILGAPMGGALAQFAGFRAMITTSAALMFGGAVYVATIAVRRGGRKSQGRG